MRLSLTGLVLGLTALATAVPVRAEVSEVVLSQQFGAVYLPGMVMEHLKLVEKNLEASGMGSVKVNWAKIGSPAALNDATISGNMHFSIQGLPSTAIIWDRTKTTIRVKALGANANNNIWLNTRNASIKSLKDFSDKDRIAIPSLKVSTQALMLQIGAEQTFGKGNFTKLDNLCVALSHPDAMIAALNPANEINSHFATSPFHENEKKAGLTTVTTAYEIMGGPMTGVNFVSSEKFREENPKVFAAVSKAFTEAIEWINADKRRASKLYIELSKEKRLTADELFAVMSTPDLEYTRTPSKVAKMLEFMHRNGLIKNKPESWKDLYFAEAHSLPGN
jgi:NitT/TauT family transport system substrate-binding protein